MECPQTQQCQCQQCGSDDERSPLAVTAGDHDHGCSDEGHREHLCEHTGVGGGKQNLAQRPLPGCQLLMAGLQEGERRLHLVTGIQKL